MSERTRTELGEVVSARASFTTLTVLAAASVALFAVTLFALVEYQRRTASALATWSLRLDDIAELGRLAGEVAAPGNDAIDSPDRASDRASLHVAESRFAEQVLALRARIPDEPVLSAALDELEQLVGEIVVEAEAVFVELARGAPEAAARHMSAMNRCSANARASQRGLRTEVTKIVRAREVEQSALFRAAGVGTGAGGVVCLALIALAFARGRRLAREELAARDALARNQAAMKRILDAVGEGLILVDRTGGVSGARSAAFERFFGPLPTGEKVWRALDGPAGEWCELSWPTIFDGSVPRELALDQLPKRHRTKDRSLALSYQLPPGADDDAQVLVVAHDVTKEEDARDASAEATDAVAAIYVAVRDPFGMEDFVEEGRRLFASLGEYADASDETALALHTLKGNASLFGLEGLTRLAHDLESRVADGETPLLAPLRERFDAVERYVAPLLRAVTYQGARVSPAELTNLVFTASTEGVPTRILAALSALVHPRISTQLEGVAERGRALAERLGTGNVRFVVDASELRVPHEPLRPFLSTLVHLVRNALDHAVEPVDARTSRGKPANLTVTFRAFGTDGRLTLEVADDGPGLDLTALARSANVPIEDARPELVFEPRLSTKSEVTSLSGRGVGLFAVHEACLRAGGRASVRTSEQGVVFTFLFAAIRV